MKYKLLLCLLLASGLLNSALAQNTNQEEATKITAEHLIQAIQKDQKANTAWWYSWLGIYSAGTFVQTGIALKTDNKALKQDMYLGAVTTVLGAGMQLLTPYPKIELDQFSNYQSLPWEQQEQLQQKAAEYLKLSAQYEKEIRSWKNHTLCTGANLACGLITWLGFDRTLKDGIINFAINTAITETQILTQPIRAKKLYEKIRSGEPSALFPEAKLNAYVTPGGFQLCLVF